MLFSVAKMPNESGTHKKIDCCHVKQNTGIVNKIQHYIFWVKIQ